MSCRRALGGGPEIAPSTASIPASPRSDATSRAVDGETAFRSATTAEPPRAASAIAARDLRGGLGRDDREHDRGRRDERGERPNVLEPGVCRQTGCARTAAVERHHHTGAARPEPCPERAAHSASRDDPDDGAGRHDEGSCIGASLDPCAQLHRAAVEGVAALGPEAGEHVERTERHHLRRA